MKNIPHPFCLFSPILQASAFSLLFLLALLACATLSLHAATPDDFLAQRGILDTPLATPQLVEVQLDAPLMADTQTDFRDLRLFDGADQETPRTIEPLYTLQERTVRKTVRSRAVALQELPDNRIEARFSLLKDEPSPDGITIRTPLKNFIRTLRISGSPDARSAPSPSFASCRKTDATPAAPSTSSRPPSASMASASGAALHSSIKTNPSFRNGPTPV